MRPLFLKHQPTPWDSRVIGLRSNQITGFTTGSQDESYESLAQFEANCLSARIGFTSTRVEYTKASIRRELEQFGYRLVELVYEVRGCFPLRSGINLSLPSGYTMCGASKDDLPCIKHIAANEFHYGRFFEDILIDDGIAKKRNECWVDDLFERHHIQVLKNLSGKVVGFQAYQLKVPNECEMILGGVDAKFAHVAYPFWSSFLNYCHVECSVDSVNTTISAANIPVVNLYNLLGFRITSVLAGYHKHRFNDPV
jgi:hypothetical protein